MRKTLVIVVCAFVAMLGGAACGDDGDGAGDSAQNFDVKVDGKTKAFASSWIQFFPSELSAHPGDTVTFTHDFTGDIHSVMGGALVEKYLKEAEKADPEAEEPPPALEAAQKKLPAGFSEEADPTKRENPFIQATFQPCFYDTGNPPTVEACDAAHQKQPESFTGKQSLFSSGYLEDQDTFAVQLDEDIAPGTYTFICGLHFEGMTTEVKVVEDDTEIPTPAEVTAKGQTELDDLEAKLKADADKVLSSTSAQAQGGAFTEDEELGEHSGGINVFPREIAIKPGGKVTWSLEGFHTVAFNAPEDARPGWTFDSSGEFVPNWKALEPQNSPKIPNPPARPEPAEGEEEEEGPPPELKVDGGRYDGSGFKASGTYLGNDDAMVVYTLTFTKAGTYQYICTVHPDMEGTVKVA